MEPLNGTPNIWETLIDYATKSPLDFDEIQKTHQIKKLELEKFTADQIRLKKVQFMQRYQKDIEECSKNWMENEYRIFIWFVLAYSNLLSSPPSLFTQLQWKDISEAFHKHPNVCRYFYLCSLKSRTQDWDPIEDSFIEEMMNSKLNKKWTQIGLELFRRTEGKNFRKPKSIRQRWLSHLNPEIKRSEWKQQEDILMLEKIREIGKKWSKIARILGNRSEHTVKNRYNKIVLRRLKKEKQTNQDAKQEEIAERLIEELKEALTKKDKKLKNQTISEQIQSSGNFTYSNIVPTFTTIVTEKSNQIKQPKNAFERTNQLNLPKKTEMTNVEHLDEKNKRTLPKVKIFKPIIISVGNFRV